MRTTHFNLVFVSCVALHAKAVCCEQSGAIDLWMGVACREGHAIKWQHVALVENGGAWNAVRFRIFQSHASVRDANAGRWMMLESL